MRKQKAEFDYANCDNRYEELNSDRNDVQQQISGSIKIKEIRNGDSFG